MGLSFSVVLMGWLIWFLINGLDVKSDNILSVSLQWAFPELFQPFFFKVREYADLLYFSDRRVSLVRELGEDFPEELSASGSHPYASLVLRCFLSTRKYIRGGRYVEKRNK